MALTRDQCDISFDPSPLRLRKFITQSILNGFASKNFQKFSKLKDYMLDIKKPAKLAETPVPFPKQDYDPDDILNDAERDEVGLVRAITVKVSCKYQIFATNRAINLKT